VEITGSVAGTGYLNAHETNKPVDRTGGTAKDSVTINTQDTQGKHIHKQFAVTDAANARVMFSPMQQLQRPALLLVNGLLYIAFGSHGDIDPYHGWVFTYVAATLKQRGIFCSTPNGGQGGIWQAGPPGQCLGTFGLVGNGRCAA
jgi:hypothetical protein